MAVLARHLLNLQPQPTHVPTWYLPVGQHSARVASLADQIALNYGLGTEQREMLRWTAHWHDLGKLALGPAIVNAPRALTDHEWMLMRQHPRIGASYCYRMGAPLTAVRIIDAHHERWDGHGYGSGLAGYTIPLGAQIIALADVFDAITSDRPYRRALSLEAALDVMQSERERAFHPELLDVALAIFQANAPRPCAMA